MQTLPNDIEVILISLFTLLSSFLLSLFFSSTRLKKYFRSGKNIQDSHSGVVPRLGGVAIVLSLFCSILIFQDAFNSDFSLLLVSLAVPVFFVGLADDISGHIHPRIRIFAVVAISMVAGHYLGWLSGIDSIGQNVSSIHGEILLILLTVFGILGFTNALNIIDGLNGLSSGVSLAILVGLFLFLSEYGDPGELNTLIMLLISGVLGFFLLNYVSGSLFLGDCGAYFIGFCIAELCIKLNSLNVVSSWAYLLLCLYPIVETVSSMFRRLLSGESVMTADAGHFHQLVLRYISLQPHLKGYSKSVINSMASSICLSLNMLVIIPAIVFAKNPLLLQAIIVLFVIIYSCLYTVLRRATSI